MIVLFFAGFSTGARSACLEQPPSRSFLDHLESLRTGGWQAIHAAAGLPMLGCGLQSDARKCLKEKNNDGLDRFVTTDSMDFSRGWNQQHPSSTMRFLADVGFGSSYWIRTSPDGRFVGMSSLILDLNPVARGLPVRRISTNQPYDPAFFPDNSGVNYAGGNFCPLSLLKEESRSSLNFTEPGCSSDGRIGLYQSLGASLNGTDFLAASGPFSGDIGRAAPGADLGILSRDAPPYWRGTGYLNLFPMVFNGQSFQVVGTQRLTTPNDADWQLGPSGTLIASRVAGGDAPRGNLQEGFRVHRIARAENSNAYSIIESAQFCARGGKATISFDERFLVFHHGLEADEFADYGFSNGDDPAFKEMLTRGLTNIFLHDLVTGQTLRVTTMAPGQYALFPNFRADGWLYFLVKVPSRNREFVVASDIALGL